MRRSVTSLVVAALALAAGCATFGGGEGGPRRIVIEVRHIRPDLGTVDIHVIDRQSHTWSETVRLGRITRTETRAFYFDGRVGGRYHLGIRSPDEGWARQARPASEPFWIREDTERVVWHMDTRQLVILTDDADDAEEPGGEAAAH
jgi:hypothetical protein